VKGSVSERRNLDCFFIFQLDGGNAGVTADAAALSSSVLATEPSTRCALPISKVSERTATTIRDPSCSMARPW
jgi:hypothetical protein